MDVLRGELASEIAARVGEIGQIVPEADGVAVRVLGLKGVQ